MINVPLARAVRTDYSISDGKHALMVPEIADVEVNQVAAQSGGPITVDGHPLCTAPGFAATAAKSNRFNFADHGMFWDLSEKTGVFHPLSMRLAFARVQMADHINGSTTLRVAFFAGSHVVARVGFSVAVAALRAKFTNHALLSPMMMKTGTDPLAAGILRVTGTYQFTPLEAPVFASPAPRSAF